MSGTVSSVEAKLEVEVDSAVSDGFATLIITKIWGSLESKHRGSTLMGGMTWVPKGPLPVKFKVDNDNLSPSQAAELFSDLMGTLFPSVKILIPEVDHRDEDSGKDDF